MPSPNQSTPASISFSLLRSRFDRFISRVFNERFVPAIRLRPPKLQLSIPCRHCGRFRDLKSVHNCSTELVTHCEIWVLPDC